jgi:hypothetical protein
VEPKVAEFNVWQDFMPVVPPSGPPLHASVTLEVQGPEKLDPATTRGMITILRSSGEQVVASDLTLNRSADDLGLAYPGPQQITFVMAPASVSVQLTQGELLHGTATLNLGTSDVTFDLPATALEFTH